MSEKPDPSAPRPKTFSIITVTKNNLDGLKRTQKSVKEQTCRDFEWIIIDGASTDGTREHLKTLTVDIPVKALSEKDDGIYEAMNKGIKRARGLYLLFLNAGDTLAAPDTLEKLLKATAKKPDFIYGDALEPDPQTPQKHHYKAASSAKNIIWGMFTHHQSMLYRRAIIREDKLRYRHIYTIAGDYEFTARFLNRAQKSLYIPMPICIFEQGGISQKNALEGRRQQYIIRESLNMASLPVNVGIFALQSLSFFLRHRAPWLYWGLKNITRARSKKT